MAEPVSIELARAQCSIAPGDETFDALLNVYILAARDWVEMRTGLLLVQREITETLDAFPCGDRGFELSWRPVTQVVGIAYTAPDESDPTLAAFTALYGKYPVRVFPASGASWPTTADNSAIIVTYTAGYADGEAPSGLVQAMLLLIGHWFQNRETVVVGVVSSEVQIAAESLCGQRRSVFC